MYFVAVVAKEIPPLLVIEFLARVIEMCIEYVGEISEEKINEHIEVLYQVNISH